MKCKPEAIFEFLHIVHLYDKERYSLQIIRIKQNTMHGQAMELNLNEMNH